MDERKHARLSLDDIRCQDSGEQIKTIEKHGDTFNTLQQQLRGFNKCLSQRSLSQRDEN